MALPAVDRAAALAAPPRPDAARRGIPRVRRPFVVAAGLTLTLLALWLASRGVDSHGLARAFGRVSWAWLVAGAAVNGAVVLCQACAWRIGLREGSLGEVPLRHALAATWIGRAANQVLPGKVGEVIRVMVIRRHARAGEGQIARLAGSLVAQRMINILGTVILVTTAAVALPTRQIPGGRWAPVLAVCAGVALILGVRRVRPGRLLPARLARVVAGFTEGAGLLKPGRPAATALALHITALLAQAGTIACVMRAFGVSAPPQASLLVIALMALAGVVAAAPGGIGVTQFAIVAPLGAVYGVGADIAFAFSVGLQATIAVVAIIGGLTGLLAERLSGPRAAAASA